MARSGNNRNFYNQGSGRRIVHTVDARTGQPVVSNLLSAMVVAPSAAQADSYGTLCMILGLEESIRFLKEHPELQAYLVWSDEQGAYQTYMTPGMETWILE